MPSNTPGRLDSVPFKQVQYSRHTALGRENAARNVTGRISAAERADPQCDRVEVRVDADLNVLNSSHGDFLPKISVKSIPGAGRRCLSATRAALLRLDDRHSRSQ